MKRFRILLLLIFGFLGLNLALSQEAAALLTVKTSHDRINIDFFYHGTALKIGGLSNPADADLIIKITSPEGLQRLRKKIKMAGLLWMNGGELKFEHSPLLYFLCSTRKLDDILSQEEMDRYSIGYPP